MIRRIFIIFAVLSVLAACGGIERRVSYPNAVTSETQRMFNEAESMYYAKRYNEADNLYKNFIENFGYNALTDDARFKRGEVSFIKKRYSEALGHYLSAYNQVYSPTIAPKAQFKAAYSLYLLGRSQEAKEEISKIRRRDASAILRVRADSLAVFADRHNAIPWYLFLIDDYAQLGHERSSLAGVPNIVPELEAEAAVKKWVEDSQVSSSQVEALPLKEYKGKRSGGYAYFKLGKALNQEGDFKKAHKVFKNYISAYPKHEYYAEARSLLGEAAGRTGDVAIKVGVILPLSGRYSVYGESVQHGIECAAGVFEPCIGAGNVQLLIKDSRGIMETAVQAVNELASQDVIAIIGPILSATSGPAAERAQELGIPMISISQRESLASIGDYIFRNTVTSESQVTTIVDYAVGRKNLKKFIILYPKNRKGNEYRDLFDQAVREAGGRVVAAHGYSSNRVEFASDIRGIELNPYEGGKSYDAIFIPDSFAIIGYLAPTLAMMGVENVRFLGISRWDDPRLIKFGGKYVEGAVFPQPFDKRSADYRVRDFITRFTGAYGMEPTLLEALGYDSLKMVVEAAAGSGATRRASLRHALESMSDFHGVTGRVSFDASGNATRQLSLLKVSSGSIVPLIR